MDTIHKNSRGMTLLYVLMALMAISFIGLNLVKLAGTDAKSGAYYGATERTRLTAISGMAAASEYFESPKNSPEFDSLLIVLIHYMNIESLSEITDEQQWIIGNSSSYVAIGASKNTFRVKITGFEKDKLIVGLRVDTKTKGGGATTLHGLYHLGGLVIDTIHTTTVDTNFIPMAAFQMEGPSNYELNGNVEVQGLTLLRGPLQVNGNITFEGNVYQYDTDSINYFTGAATFKGDTYLGGHLDVNNVPTFEMSVGFGGSVRAKPITIGGNLYHNGVTKDWAINGNPPNAVHSSQYNTQWSVNGSVYSYNSTYYPNGATSGETKLNIDSLMGFVDLPGPIFFDTTVFNGVTSYYTGEKMTPSDMNSLYATAVTNGDTTCGGFMVLRAGGAGVAPSAEITKNGGGTFDGKAIFILDGNYELKSFPKSSSSSNIILYVTNRTTHNAATIQGLFRGVIYVHESNFTIQPGNTTTRGSVYYSEGSHQDYHAGGITHIYDESVLRESACIGVFTPGDSSAIPVIIDTYNELHLADGYAHIETQLMSRGF